MSIQKNQTKPKTIKKLISFTPEELEYIQNFKHANKLSSDTQAVKKFISLNKEYRKNFIISSIKRNAKILAKLADK